MAEAFHGTTVLFDKFDLSHATEGDGKVKFGFGVYVTERYETAAHYAFNKNRPDAKPYYVYTVEIPDLTEDNVIALDPHQKVREDIVSRIEKGLGEKLPEYAIQLAKEMRRYLANKLSGRDLTPKKMIASDIKDIEGEKRVAEFFNSIGFDYYQWPVGSWDKPGGPMNYAVLSDSKVKITKVDAVELNDKHQLIEGSSVQVR